MTKLKELSRAELARISGGTFKLVAFDSRSRGGYSQALPPFGGGMPGGPLMEPILKWCADHPGACTNIPPTQPSN